MFYVTIPCLFLKYYICDFFNSFLEKRSWEPGWLADFRKDAWDKFIALPKAKVKDEMWRFSPRARLGYSNFDSLKESVKQVTLLNQNSNGAIFETFDQAILNNPNLTQEQKTEAVKQVQEVLAVKEGQKKSKILLFAGIGIAVILGVVFIMSGKKGSK